MQGVGDGVLKGGGDAVEQFTDFIDGQGYQSGRELVTGAPFFVAPRVTMRKAAAAMDRVMCRYLAIPSNRGDFG